MTDEVCHALFAIALGIEAEILLLAKDCSGKPDLKGNALRKTNDQINSD